jgi:hypothetical protein
MAQVMLGESCNLLRYGNQVYSISSSGLTSVGFTSTIQASSSDLQYLISGGILYKYSAATNSYSQFRTLAGHSTYWISSSSNKIVAWGADAAPSGPKFTINQTIYAILDNSGSANVFFQQNFQAFESVGQRIQVHVSPLMRKLHYEYIATASGTSPTVYLYDLDWTTPASSQLTLGNPSSYLDVIKSVTTYTKQNFYFGDYYWVVRNDTSSSGAGTKVESTYQFLGDEVLPLRQRNLAANELTSSPYMTYIDDYFLEELIVLDLYANGDATYPGYNIYEYSYGNLASTVRVIPPPPSDYINYNLPSATTTLTSSTKLEWDQLSVSATTVFTRIK